MNAKVTIFLWMLCWTGIAFGQSGFDTHNGAIVKLTRLRPVSEVVDGETMEVWYRNTAGRGIRKTESLMATGFLLSSGDDGKEAFLATAAHVARGMDQEAILTVRGPSFTPRRLLLRDLVFDKGTNSVPIPNWLFHKEADCALIRLRLEPGTAATNLSHVQWIPTTLLARSNPPPRDEPLTLLGFPLGIGDQVEFSPISQQTFAASGNLIAGNVTFFFSQSPGIGGYSGAPYISLPGPRFSGGGIRVRGGTSQCWGLLTRTDSDDSGGKLARVVHAKHLIELLDQLVPKDQPKAN